jgi:hypothetical protein
MLGTGGARIPSRLADLMIPSWRIVGRQEEK